MNEPYPFSVRTCPNREWHPQIKRRCPMCGLSGPAFRFGERLAAILVGSVIAAAVVLVTVLVVRWIA